jgi:transcriptional regulator with AAA-type ATPase domain
MQLIDRHKPTRLGRIIGNTKALARIEKAVDQNDGFGGLIFMLTGQTGNGKTLIADLRYAKRLENILFSLCNLCVLCGKKN